MTMPNEFDGGDSSKGSGHVHTMHNPKQQSAPREKCQECTVYIKYLLGKGSFFICGVGLIFIGNRCLVGQKNLNLY